MNRKIELLLSEQCDLLEIIAQSRGGVSADEATNVRRRYRDLRAKEAAKEQSHD